MIATMGAENSFHIVALDRPDAILTIFVFSHRCNQYIQDPSFIDSEFFDPRDLIQVRYEMLRRVRMARICAIAHPSTVRPRWRGTPCQKSTSKQAPEAQPLMPAKQPPSAVIAIT
jgi:hypothetical protein